MRGLSYLFSGYACVSFQYVTMQFGSKPLFENISVKFGAATVTA